MRNVNRRFFLILSVAGTLMSLGEASASFTARSYLPIRPGNFWTYQADDGSTFTTTVLPGTTLVNGVATTVLQDNDGFTNYFTNDNNGVRLHRQIDPDFGITATYSPPVKLASAVTDIGQTVNSSGTAVTNLGNVTYSSSYTIEALENVTVPAGNFTTIRVRGAVTLCSGSVCETATHIIYLARGIGLVKEVVTSPDENYTNELIATNVRPTAAFADFDADRKSDIGIYRNGVWTFIRSSDGGNTVVNWGGTSWQPVPGDYDGDGKTDIAVYNSSVGVWSIIRSSDGGNTVVNWGGSLWQPVPADYDGDGKTDIAVYNSSAGGVWSIIRSSDGGNTVVNWGGSLWQPVPADYDGDGKTDIAVYKTNAGVWSIIRSSDSGNTVVNWGGPSWEPVPADYDGDGKADIGVYYRPYGVWSIIRSSDGANTVVGWGGESQDVALTRK